MTPRSYRTSWLIAFVFLVAVLSNQGGAQEISFNRDIRPILSDKCFHCHGPDASHREADLRLDDETSAKEIAVSPGNPDESELIARILTEDPDLVMPPPELGKPISADEAELLKNWIDQGAQWQPHWSFVSPERPEVPQLANDDWSRNAIDSFVLAKLRELDWKPSAEATPHALVRRLCLDLTGLPPTPEQLERFVKSPTEANYEQLVDELLDSPHYGERMAMVWLDAARYADTDGFQIDETRSNWPWRDWVVDAYNQNQPFDEFTVDQFAGDLRPDASEQQILATCFHRNHMTNGEGGRDPEESRIDYVIDRVNTMGTVWLGLTLGCSQCHSHKYDPVSHREYYQLNAFFNSINEDGRAGRGAGPHLKVQSNRVEPGLADARHWQQHQLERQREIEAAELTRYASWLQQQRDTRQGRSVQSSWQVPTFKRAFSSSESSIGVENNEVLQVTGENARHDDYVLVAKPATKRVTGMRLTVLPDPRNPSSTLSQADDGHLVLTNLKLSLRSDSSETLIPIDVDKATADHQTADSGRRYGPVATVLDDDPRTGWTTQGRDATEARVALFRFGEPIVLGTDQGIQIELRHRSLQGYASMRRFKIEFTLELGPTSQTLGQSPLEQLWSLPPDESVPAAIDKQLRAQFLAEQAEVVRARERVAEANRRVSMYENAAKPLNVMVLAEREKPRKTHILKRGVWDKKGEVVRPNVPAFLVTSKDMPPVENRLALARWLTDPRHPLTARVAVNRYWQMYFGRGLVQTTEDFGSQGSPPSHPLLLDWLALEFIDSGWDVKHLQRLIVTSATYRQSSTLTAESWKRDPSNQWLARGSRFRMPAWMIRDVVLANSGLLEKRIGGPPVYPSQPAGAWAASTMGRFHYSTSVGTDRYRRSLYSFWRRSVAPTGFFDASKRRVCQVRVVRTNTPLHALTLLNDSTMMDASIALADQSIKAALDDVAAIEFLVQRVLQRDATSAERNVLIEQLGDHCEYFETHPQDIASLFQNLNFDVHSPGSASLAARTLVASTLLNLDEAITRE